MSKKRNINKKGIALVTLLIFTVMAMIIFTTAAALMVENTKTTQSNIIGNQTFYDVESEIQETKLRLLRDREFIQDDTIIIEKSNNGYTKKVELSIEFINGEMVTNYQREVE